MESSLLYTGQTSVIGSVPNSHLCNYLWRKHTDPTLWARLTPFLTQTHAHDKTVWECPPFLHQHLQTNRLAAWQGLGHFNFLFYRPTDIHRPTDTRHGRVLVIHDSVDPRKAKVLRTHAAPQGLCDNLINSLKLFTNQQKDGDSLDEHFVTGLREKSRKDIVGGLRKLVHRRGQTRNSECGRLAPRQKMRPGGEACSHPRRSGRTDTVSRRSGCTAHLHRYYQCGGPSTGASAGRCRLACILPGHPSGKKRTRVGNDHERAQFRAARGKEVDQWISNDLTSVCQRAGNLKERIMWGSHTESG